MEYYNIKDAVAEGVLLKVKLNCDTQNEYIRKLMRERKAEDSFLLLPFHMAECLLDTEYLQVVEVLGEELEAEIEGAPASCCLEGKILYRVSQKLEEKGVIDGDVIQSIRQAHAVRMRLMAERLGDTEEAGLELEELEILRRGRRGWRKK